MSREGAYDYILIETTGTEPLADHCDVKLGLKDTFKNLEQI